MKLSDHQGLPHSYQEAPAGSGIGPEQKIKNYDVVSTERVSSGITHIMSATWIGSYRSPDAE